MKPNLIFLFLISLCVLSHAQITLKPEIGKPMPDFYLREITHYDVSEATLGDFNGKWLLLEFWYSGCATCIKSLPKIDALRDELKDQMEFITIGCTDPVMCYGTGLRETYEALRKKMDLQAASAYDSLLFKEWKIFSMPRVIIVDPGGIVRAITDGRDLTAEKLRALISGEEVSFYLPAAINPPSPFVPALNEGALYYSLLTEWKDEKRYINPVKRELDIHKKNIYTASKVTLYELYNLAYFGQPDFFDRNKTRNPLYGEINFKPVVEVDDKSWFIQNGEPKYYNFSISVPSDSVDVQLVMRAIQSELKNIFNYDAHIEKREMPVWRLTASRRARKLLKTKGGKTYFSDKSGAGGAAGFTCRNCTMYFFTGFLTHYINTYDHPYIDSTGIDGNIDITIDALLTDFNQIDSELRRNGLSLTKSEKKMTVIVITDN